VLRLHLHSNSFKGIVHPKINTKEDILKNVSKQMVDSIVRKKKKKKYYGSQWLPSTRWLSTFFKISSFCSTEERFGITQGWVNDDRIFIFGWTTPLSDDSILQRPCAPSVCECLKSIMCMIWRPWASLERC